jgi:hypothetical protein
MPHHRPWWGGPIRLLYAGFDGLDVAFQGCLSNPVLALLTDARAEAEAINGPVAREINGLRFTVAASGAKHGFRYRLDTGDDGEVWLIKHNADPRQWNLFASVRAFALLTYGYPGVRRRFQERLAALEATVAAASVNRVDVACDLDVPGFEPEPDCFVAPARTQSRSYHPEEGVRAAEVTAYRLARRVSGVTVGHMPGRQLCFYDKRADSLIKRKPYWAQIWGLNLAEHREPIWRVEVRAGRDELARHIPIRSFEELEAGLADIVASILTKLRYVLTSPTDLNRGRWPTHPLWDVATQHVLATIEAHAFAPAPPRRDLPTPLAVKRDMLERQLIGLARSYGALAGVREGQAGEIGGLIRDLLDNDWRKHPDKAEENLARARARYGAFG